MSIVGEENTIWKPRKGMPKGRSLLKKEFISVERVLKRSLKGRPVCNDAVAIFMQLLKRNLIHLQN